MNDSSRHEYFWNWSANCCLPLAEIPQTPPSQHRTKLHRRPATFWKEESESDDKRSRWVQTVNFNRVLNPGQEMNVRELDRETLATPAQIAFILTCTAGVENNLHWFLTPSSFSWTDGRKDVFNIGKMDMIMSVHISKNTLVYWYC